MAGAGKDFSIIMKIHDARISNLMQIYMIICLLRKRILYGSCHENLQFSMYMELLRTE